MHKSTTPEKRITFQANSPRRNYKPETVEPNVYQQFSKTRSYGKEKSSTKELASKDDNKIQVTTNSIDDDSDSALPLDTI